MTIKIAHLADTHLGYKQYGIIDRELDYYEAFSNVIDDIIEKNVDYVIHSGDLFEQPKPPIKALLTAQKGFLKLIEHGIDIIVIAGNHDILNRKASSIPQELYENEHFHILTIKNRSFVAEDLIISGLPFIQKSHEELVKKMLDEMRQEAESYKHKILMLHGGVSKYFEFSPEFEIGTIPHGFDYYAMGHIHQRILEKFNEGILSYPGSTEIKDKGEISEYDKNGKGYNLLTLDDSINVEYVNIKLKRKFLVETIKYPELDEKLDKLETDIRNEILNENTKKPVLLLTVKDGDFNRTDVSQKVNEKLDDLCLTVRLTYEPTPIGGHDPVVKSDIDPKHLIKKTLTEMFENDTISQMGVELYETLSTNNLEKAEEISEIYYNKIYENRGEEE